jgi:hypothetical protein
MSREQLGALLQLIQPTRSAPGTQLDRAKAAMCQFCSEWYTDIRLSYLNEPKKLDEDDEYKAVRGLVLEKVHGINSVRFLKDDVVKTLWRELSASPIKFNFVHAASSYLSNQIATIDSTGWATLIDEISRAESALSDSKTVDDASRSENLELLPNLTLVKTLLENYPWMVTLYVIMRCRYTKLFTEV